MKKMIILMTAAALLLSTGSFAAGVNEKALSAFAKDFSGASSVKWEEMENFLLVQFKVNDVWFGAAYNEEGELLASSKKIELGDLPVAVTQAINKKYMGYQLGNNANAITIGGKTYYYLTIANSNQVLNVKVDAAGYISVEQKKKLDN
jgi:predicted DNA-binding protein (MmcQ/YjbR family)